MSRYIHAWSERESNNGAERTRGDSTMREIVCEKGTVPLGRVRWLPLELQPVDGCKNILAIFMWESGRRQAIKKELKKLIRERRGWKYLYLSLARPSRLALLIKRMEHFCMGFANCMSGTSHLVRGFPVLLPQKMARVCLYSVDTFDTWVSHRTKEWCNIYYHDFAGERRGEETRLLRRDGWSSPSPYLVRISHCDQDLDNGDSMQLENIIRLKEG